MNSIAFRLRATYIFLAIGPLLLVGVVLTWLNVSIQLDRARALQQELVPLVASQVEAFIVDLQEELQTVSQISNIRSLTTAEQQEITDQIQTTNNNVFAEVTLLDADGIVLTHSSFLDINTESERGRQATGPEFLVPIETGEIYFGPVRFDESTGVSMKWQTSS
jgi:hypothetical protein